MKLSKKKVVALALAVCLIAILSMGSLAWFTAEDEVTNNFYVGDTETDAGDVFGIDLWENRDTNGDGDYNEEGDAEEAEGLVYEDILPGEVLSKEPHLENTGIHPQYVRAIVTVTEADILREAMIPKGADVSEWWDVPKFLPGTDAKWELVHKFYTNKDTFVFVYYYTEALAAGTTTEQLFDAVVIPTELTKEQAAEMDNFDIKIVGQAIQSEHLADVTNAKEAFAKYWDEPGVIAGVNQQEDLPTELSYPVSGNLGTISNGALVEYDPDNYVEPGLEGVLVFSGAEADIKAGASLITIPADGEMNPTILLENVDLTIEEGGYILSTENGSSGTVIFYGVTINGEKIDTYDELNDAESKYFNNFNGSAQF